MKKLVHFLLITVCTLLLFSCEKNNDPTKPSKLTPEENKAKIEEIGVKFVGKINPKDQEQMIGTLVDFADFADDDSFYDIFKNIPSGFSLLSQTLVESIKTGNLLPLLSVTKASYKIDYHTLISKCSGIYTYASFNWKKTGDMADGIQFVFTSKSLKCEMTLKCSGDNIYSNYSGYIVTVPKEVLLTYNIDGKSALKLEIKQTLSTDQKAINGSLSLTLAGDYVGTISDDISETALKINSQVKIKGEKVLSFETSFVTANLTNPDFWKKYDDIEIWDVAKSVDMSFSVLNVGIRGKSDLASLLSGLDRNDSKYPNYKEEWARNMVDLYNNNASLKLYYTDSNSLIADVKMELSREKNGSYEYWYASPTLVFASDGSKIEVETFFNEVGFNKFINSLESLINEYGRMIGADPIRL